MLLLSSGSYEDETNEIWMTISVIFRQQFWVKELIFLEIGIEKLYPHLTYRCVSVI